METKPSTPIRRRLRLAFSLRTLFVLITVVCAWLAWNASFVQQRARFQRALETETTGLFTLNDDAAVQTHSSSTKAFVHRMRDRVLIGNGLRDCTKRADPQAAEFIPRVRRWLGDVQAYVVIVNEETDFKRAGHLFPEATILLVPKAVATLNAAQIRRDFPK
jgi:hypothetical protein